MSEPHNWTETKLWQQLTKLESEKRAEAEAVCTTLRRWMPDIQQILTSGGTTPTDFTLHDAQHAFRVAERMIDVVPADVFTKLSLGELALLLLAAYLHDIGMSPQQGPIRLLYEYLLTGEVQDLPQDQINSFIRWLDDQDDEVKIPLVKDTLTPDILRYANMLIAHYCRACHADWSEKWIDSNLNQENLGSYAQWVGDLKAICRSHHENYNKLISDQFDPKPVGTAGFIVHPRYLAAVLRIADVLEFDPERTPDVIFKHRDINPASAIFWHKDHSVTPLFDNGQVTIVAEPLDARIYRAIEIMAAQIEAELRLVRHIDNKYPFEMAQFLRDERLYHRWDLFPDLNCIIRPKSNSYEYIDGAFRPDTQKLLHLLSGKELYGNELVAIRELLQNAFDAVREQLAYERLDQQDPANEKWEQIFGDIHQVVLTLKYEDDRIWLTCTDSGSGMSKALISNNLLISGNRRRRDIRSLERRCKESGFELERTSQFGIGVLSYFMLADQVEIRTKRSSSAEDADETTGWFFETDGVGSFGELRKDPAWRRGTQVRLRIRRDVVKTFIHKIHTYQQKIKEKKQENLSEFDKIIKGMGDLNDFPWWNQECKQDAALAHLLLSYLKLTLRQLPCKLQVNFELEPSLRQSFPRGWVKTPMDMVDIALENLLKSYEIRRLFDQGGLISFAKEQELTAERFFYQELPIKIKSCLDWETFSGELPDDLGVFRIHFPIFDLPGGKSNYYLHIDHDEAGKEITVHKLKTSSNSRFVYKPRGELYMSWKGMVVKQPTNPDIYYYGRREEDAIIEIDWKETDAGVLSVSRESIILSDVGQKALEWLRLQVIQAYTEFAASNQASPYVALTKLLLLSVDGVSAQNDRDYWLFLDTAGSDHAIWGPVQFPAIDCVLADSYQLREENYQLKWKGETVHQFQRIQLTNEQRYQGLSEATWGSVLFSRNMVGSVMRIGFPPDRLVCFRSEERRVLTGLWYTQPSYKPVHYDGFLTRFPPNWGKLICASLSYHTERSINYINAWNCEHPLCTIPSDETKKWATATFYKNDEIDLDPEPHREALLEDRERAKAWLALVMSTQFDADEFWNALIDKKRELLNTIWDVAFGHSKNIEPEHSEIYKLDNYHLRKLLIFTPNSLQTISDSSKIESLLPDPGPDWTLEVVKV